VRKLTLCFLDGVLMSFLFVGVRVGLWRLMNTSIEERNAICSMVPDDTSKCKKLRKVWYFDQQRGRCIKSKGCSFTGNTFRRRLTCKNMCKGRKSKKQERKQRIQFVS
jgi:hypothetical protein